ncbi:hypothetical protein L3C95_32645 [Chitinophaga filiformis]|uniref:hypothetical protein n=1 Tax=Chitinophaga filiformis TaxID=104663 RepID=UPI001F3BE696|nr:hypothetical protein [Chitinophaga filiformis]MCF6407612.1 hypothetical protein [Chitinophaga filiformis]MCF6407683.1 hypothetical protein [Chitinophaga filiformis]
MEKALIKLSFRQIIDMHARTSFEKDVFHESYNEFLMQVQAYNRDHQFSTWEQVRGANPKAGSLNYKVGFSIGLFVKELQQQIPGLTDNLGNPVPFESHRFEIVASDITNKAAHKVAIVYTTATLTLLGVLGDYMLLTTGELLSNPDQQEVQTFMLKIQPQLSVSAYALQGLPQ